MAIGDVKRWIDPVVVSKDADGGGIVVGAGRIQRKGAHSVLGQLGKDAARTGIVDAVENPRDVVVGKRRRVDGFTQQQFGVLFCKKALQPVERAASRKGVEHHGQHGQPGAGVHLVLDQGIDGADEIDAFCVVLDDGQVPDIGDGQSVGVQVEHVFFSSQGYRVTCEEGTKG